VDKTIVKRVLASYCPPLSPRQVEAVASKVAELSKSAELSDATAKAAARRQKRSRKVRSHR
jgi:hypothetical protein